MHQKFQDLEEERLDFTKSSLWTYANIASTACVSDDQAFETIRVSLEGCEVEKDIGSFINELGTGQEIPDPPKFINFCRGDINDTSSETEDEDNYSVAQFHRTINPAYRSSSPQPSTYESHHDPDSELALKIKNDPATPSSREATVTPQKAVSLAQDTSAPDSRRKRHAPSIYDSSQHGESPNVVQNEDPADGTAPQGNRGPDSRRGRHAQLNYHPSQHGETPSASDNQYSTDAVAHQTGSTPDSQQGRHIPPNYDPNQHGEIPKVPHNEYPADGMTMFCRTGPASEKSSGASIYRPSSRDSRSEISNPTSFSSVEPPSSRQSPTKLVNQAPQAVAVNNKQQSPPKKKSTFFSNSPFRRKSKHEKERQQPVTVNTNRNTWAAPKQISPTKPSPFQPRSSFADDRQPFSPEPADPRASFQLNVGNNVFDVASPDKTGKQVTSKGEGKDVDPIAQALADLKGVGKHSSVRVSADRYHGISTPKPPPAPTDGNVASAQRGTPPPAYNDASARRLDAPQPAFTSAQMQKTTRKYVGKTQDMFNSPSRSDQRPSTARSQTVPRPSTATTQATPRGVSPAPGATRSVSPRPFSSSEQRQSQYARPSSSSNHYQTQYTPSASKNNSANSRYRQSPSIAPANPIHESSYSPQYSRHNSPAEVPRPAASPRPQYVRAERPGSSNGMELQLSSNQVDPYYGQPAGSVYGGSQRGHGHYDERPLSMYYGNQDNSAGNQVSRARSQSVAAADGRQYSRDGRPVLHYGKLSFLVTSFLPVYLC